jgi:hypothetical protein
VSHLKIDLAVDHADTAGDAAAYIAAALRHAADDVDRLIASGPLPLIIRHESLELETWALK